MAARIPVTVITGYLGAGKTTLVNRLLAVHAAEAIGIVVNEFGEVGIDGGLIEANDEAVIEISNGCVCCTVRADLVRGVLKLIEKSPVPLTRLIVETSGLADPAPVLQSFLADAALRERVRLESVVTVVDAHHLQTHLDDALVREQIAFADLLLVSKCDVDGAPLLTDVTRSVRALNPSADIARCYRGVTAVSVFGIERFSLTQVLAIEPGLLTDDHAHEHDDAIASVALTHAGPLDPDRLQRWLNRLVQREGRELLRMKGVLELRGEGRRFQFHSVHMLLEMVPGPRWPVGAQRMSCLVLIGRGLDRERLAHEFSECGADAPSHAGLLTTEDAV